MKQFKRIFFIIFLSLLGLPAFAQSFYRPWSSYIPIKPQKSYKSIDTLNDKLRQSKCYYKNVAYEPNQIITDLDINREETFTFFKQCCNEHPSRCVSDYIGNNNKTLLYTMVEKKAYRYMRWILNEGFVYDSPIDTWGIYKNANGIMVPLRNYNPMMLACKEGDLEAVKILRVRGAYLSKPENAIGLTPYDIANQNSQNKSQAFIRYIEQEYKEETQNIYKDKQYGKDFGLNLPIETEIFEFLEENYPEYQKKIIEKICLLNRC